MRNVLSLVVVASFAATARQPEPHPSAGGGPSAAFATVSGTVFDSIGGTVLVGARVQLVSVGGANAGRSYAAESDSSGRYAIADLPPGGYAAGFHHAMLDTLGIESTLRRVDVGTPDYRLNLATPSPSSVIRGLCPSRQGTDSTGVLIGHVRETESEQPIVGANVTVEWTETAIDARGLRTRPRMGRVQTDGPGWFAICGLPGQVALAARAAHGADSSGYVEIELPENGVRHVTLFVGGGALVRSGPSDPRVPAESRAVWRGRARLTGRVTDATGKPLANAQLILWGSDREARTSEAGAFGLDSLPGGTHTVEVKALGYAPVRRAVQLAEGRPATAEIRLTERAQVLSSVIVRGELLFSKNLAEYDRRRRSTHVGHFISPREIEQRPLTRLTSLLQDVPFVRVDRGQRGGPRVFMEDRGPGTFCPPSLFVDGRPDVIGDFDIYKSDEIAAIEVYRRDSDRPLEFTDTNKCGAIVIWTRPAPRNVKPAK